MRISDWSSDVCSSDLIQAAREWVEDFTGLVLVSRPFTKAVEAFGSYVQLDRRPVTAVESIAYLDTDGAEQPFTDFTINLATGRVYASQWPAIGRNGYATVTYPAGYAPEEVPVDRKRGVVGKRVSIGVEDGGCGIHNK